MGLYFVFSLNSVFLGGCRSFNSNFCVQLSSRFMDQPFSCYIEKLNSNVISNVKSQSGKSVWLCPYRLRSEANLLFLSRRFSLTFRNA